MLRNRAVCALETTPSDEITEKSARGDGGKRLLSRFFRKLLRNLPTAALAGVVMASAIGLIEVADLWRIYRMQRWEF